MKIRVLVADDHVVVREGLRAILALQEDIEVVGEASNGREAVQMTRQLAPEIVLLDVFMPQLNGVEAIREIRQASAGTRVLILSASGHEQHVEKAIEMGATGYVLKNTAGNDLVRAIREARKGNSFFSDSITQRMQQRERQAALQGNPRGAGRPPLTPRQIQVLQLIAEGNSNKMIADALQISIKTVEKHRQQLMDNLNIHETASLTRHAVASGMIEPSAPKAA